MAIPFQQDGNYSVFPYRENYKDGSRVNGGMDLVARPELIDCIHEIQDFPELQQMLHELNRPQGLYRTLGIDIGRLDGNWYGYLEISSRVPDGFQGRLDWTRLDEAFAEYLLTTLGAPAEIVDSIRKTLKMEWRWVEIYGQPQQAVVTVFPLADTATHWTELLGLFAKFLLSLDTP